MRLITDDVVHEAAEETATQYVLQPEDEAETTDAAPVADGTRIDHSVIVAEQPTAIARLSVSEAVMRLDLTHQPVLMFRNSGSGVLNVVYRRADGCVGWIDAPAG